MDDKLAALSQIYRVLQDATSDYALACHRGCAACCTLNVTLTTLEAYQIIVHLKQTERPGLLEQLSVSAGKQCFEMEFTLNTLAQRYADSDHVSEEQHSPDFRGVCPLLVDDACAIYNARPLACRTMVSNSDCRKTGYATMDPFLLAVNNVLMQFVEHVDQGGLTGSLVDILLYLSDKENRRHYEANTTVKGTNGMLVNHPLTVLMVPPEHRQPMAPVLRSLNPAISEIT